VIPQALRERTQWLVWRLEDKPDAMPGDKQAKVPYYTNGARRYGEQGSVSDLSQLTTLDHAMETMSRGKFTGVGFAFLPEDGLIGIDLDRAFDQVTDPETGEVTRGEMRPEMLGIVKACQSFTEFSPSGFGLHIYAFGKATTFKSNDIGVEVFCGRQFFTVTGDQLLGTPDAVNDLSPQALELLRGMVETAKEQRRVGNGAASSPRSAPAPARTSAPVTAINNDFAKVNAAAMGNFDAWVPTLFPQAKRTPGGYRVTQKSLGRDLQEDLAIHVDGIVDFGVADVGDAKQGKRSPIDLVMEWGAHKTAKDALHWLAGQLGIDVKRRESTGSRPTSAGRGAPPDGADNSPPDEPPSEGVPRIQWRDGHLPEIVDQAEDALLAREDDRLYQRLGFLVRVVRKEMFSVRNYKRPPGVLGTVPVQAPYLTELFTRSAYWERWDSRKNDWRRVNAPKDVAATYLARNGQWKVPVLWSTVSAPTMRPDGSVMQTPGYDAAMRAYYDPGGIDYPKVPERPTLDEAKAALALLKKAVSTFPFEDAVDRAVALAMLLTTLVRRSLPSAPLFGVTAPSPESGKTLLADFAGILAMGTVCPAMKYADTDEEAAKVATAVLLEGDPLIMIDNVERMLQGDWLCTMLTSESYKGRVLGLSQMANLATNCTWVATGNHLLIGGDLRFRSLLCRLDAKMERPGERVFSRDFREWAVAHRPQLVAAGLTLMRAFVTSKHPARELCPPWGRFEHWTDMVRCPLIWLGEQDPCASLSALEQDDPERQEHLRILHAWWARIADRVVTARELVDVALDASVGDPNWPFKELVQDISADRQGVLKPKRLSHWLRRHAGRRVSGYQLVKMPDNNDHTATWRVEKVEGMSE
jgi:hypothetical protein